MIAYVDASVVLRLLLSQPESLSEWTEIHTAVSSALTEVECLRTLDRLGQQKLLTIDQVARIRETTYRFMAEMEVVAITAEILRRASEPFPTPLGTLDAIHLSTALAWRDAHGASLHVATHDKALATAARSVGLEVIGD